MMCALVRLYQTILRAKTKEEDPNGGARDVKPNQAKALRKNSPKAQRKNITKQCEDNAQDCRKRQSQRISTYRRRIIASLSRRWSNSVWKKHGEYQTPGKQQVTQDIDENQILSRNNKSENQIPPNIEKTRNKLRLFQELSSEASAFEDTKGRPWLKKRNYRVATAIQLCENLIQIWSQCWSTDRSIVVDTKIDCSVPQSA